MRIDWSPLKAELAIWRRENLCLPIWWRDDDAVADTPELQRLAHLAQDIGLPVHIAVIPDLIEPSLPQVVETMPQLVPVVHGWRHISHAPEGAKNAEFGHPRKGAEGELRSGMRRLHTRFGARLLPMFVPPWNRMDPTYFAILADAGYCGLSTYGPRESQKNEGLQRVNTHVDPIFWRGDRGLVPPETLVTELAKTLCDRREGRSDISEPLGLLTHHLVHTEDVWAFSADLARLLLDGGAVPADLRAILGGA